jgi:hypothetical protein
MLQAGALAGADLTNGDYQLRIPTRIRALSVGLPGPGLPLGSDGARARIAQHPWPLKPREARRT